MLDPKDVHKLDQLSARSSEIWATLWWGLFEALLRKGFTTDQALQILCTKIHADSVSINNGIERST